MARKMVDCRKMPSEIGCTLTIAGEEQELLDAAAGTPWPSTVTRTRRSCGT